MKVFMIKTIFLDVGGTIYIKDNAGAGMLNPAIGLLLESIPKSAEIIILSDTDVFDVPKLLGRDFPELAGRKIFTKKDYPWIDKTDPETFLRVCSITGKNPQECVLVDNETPFRNAAELAGILTFGITPEEIKRLINLL